MAASEAAYKLPFGFAKAAVQTKGANKSCTFTDTGDVVGVVGHGYSDGDRVVFSAITTTTGITINTYYYVRDATADTFKVAATSGGSALTLTTDGTGTVAKLFETRLRMAQRITGTSERKDTQYEGDDVIIRLTNLQSVGFTFDADSLPVGAHAVIFGLSEVTSNLPDSYTSAYGLFGAAERVGVQCGFWGEGTVTSYTAAGVQSSKTGRFWYPNGRIVPTQPPALQTSDKPGAFQYTFNVTDMEPTVDIMGVALPVTGKPLIYLDK